MAQSKQGFPEPRVGVGPLRTPAFGHPHWASELWGCPWVLISWVP